MKKTTAIIAALVVVAVFAFAGCQKQEAPKPAEQSAVTSTMTSTVTSTMPMATPEKK
jgi:ABC-type glycerol-3-phosphate transport system substrate-binding protein